MAGGDLPSGILTFLFTDLADSTSLWAQYGQEMGKVMARHNSILVEVVERHAGRVVKLRGDGLMAAFADVDSGVRAAVDGLQVVRCESLPVPVRVRVGWCTGPAREMQGDYYGPVIDSIG